MNDRAQKKGDSMEQPRQRPSEWVRSVAGVPEEVTDEALETAAMPPSTDVYDRREATGRIILHHTATRTGSAESVRALHRAVNGWVDIGYHYIIGNGSLSPDGEVQTGRPEWAVGAHARNNNDDSIGVCLVGDFDDHRPSQAQLDSLGRLLQTLMERYDLTSSDIIMHRGAPGCDTACPGRNFPLELVLLRLRG